MMTAKETMNEIFSREVSYRQQVLLLSCTCIVYSKYRGVTLIFCGYYLRTGLSKPYFNGPMRYEDLI